MRCKVLLSLLLLALVKSVSSSTVWVHQNSSALLPCSVSLSLISNSSLLEVAWVSDGELLASHSPSGAFLSDGFSWDPSLFANGNFSLTVERASWRQQGTYVCQTLYNSSELSSSNVTLGVEVPPSLSVVSRVVVLDVEGELTCLAEGFNPPLINFTWSREGEVVGGGLVVAAERGPGGLYRATGGLTVFPSLDDQNVTFACQVTHVALEQPLSVAFQLSFVYLPVVRLSTIPSSSRDTPLTLSCDVEGFYPEEVSVSWVQNGSALPDPRLSEQGPDGTFSTRRFYTLSPAQREQAGEVGCVVRQAGLSQISFASGHLEELDPVAVEDPVLTKSAKASVALMCISLVLVLLLCFGFSWRRRDEKLKSLMVSGIILPPRVIVGQKGRVTLSIEGRMVDRVQTAWFLNDTPISDTSLRVSEKGPLLPPAGEQGYYKLHAPRPLVSTSGSSQQLLSSLSFMPQISVHKGAVFRCQVSYIGKDKVVAERVSEKFTILAAPEVSEIQLTEAGDDSGVVTLTVQASHFHPDIITFRWFCQGGELSPVASQAGSAPRPDAQGFFSAWSCCRLPRSELESGGTKVWVSIHHTALKQPVTRETRGFIKRPRVSEIVSSASSSPERPLTLLGCDITGFYPADISVTWLRLGEGEEDDREEEPEEGGELWGPVLTHPDVYRASATLRREGRRGGGGVICRVEHCSLDEPIERCWRNIPIAAPSIPPSLSVSWTSEGVGVFSLLLSGGHPRPTLLWAAGGATLSPLGSTETEGKGEDGERELRSVCGLERASTGQRVADRQMGQTHNRHALKTQAAVSDPDAEGIQFIDEKLDADNKNIDRKKVVPAEVEGETEALHINRVYLSRGPRGEEREPLRVSVEVTHPALALAVHRTWTEPTTEVSPSC
ncbi:uncharacterized protein si:ch211-180a12.2 [Osmerus eperlanus]|uniref:uncharacterized protein si:ch211-180a12.2 n=1 Tax=Osmerus eperlanus TaxID=29151 RepID=UPI002E167765